MLPPEAQLSAALARHGIGEGTRVVLYSAGSMMWATRVWWMLHAFGFDDAAVLDGGWEKWRAEARPIDTAPSAYPPATFVPRPRPGRFVDKRVVLAAIDDPNVRLINTLSEPDFRGDGPGRYGRPGRIPGSVNLPWPSLTEAETGTFIPLADEYAIEKSG
jgi:thiosulfate/3-mercaptopyruvate sulfurtransferase